MRKLEKLSINLLSDPQMKNIKGWGAVPFGCFTICKSNGRRIEIEDCGDDGTCTEYSGPPQRLFCRHEILDEEGNVQVIERKTEICPN